MEWTLIFFRQIIYFSSVNHSTAADHRTLRNGTLQLSEASWAFLSRFHLWTLIIGWSTFCETKQTRSIQNGKKFSGAPQRGRDSGILPRGPSLRWFWILIHLSFQGAITASPHSLIMDKYTLSVLCPRYRDTEKTETKTSLPSNFFWGWENKHVNK